MHFVGNPVSALILAMHCHALKGLIESYYGVADNLGVIKKPL
jgi:hypothetical protein